MNGYMDMIIAYRKHGINKRHARKVGTRMYFGRKYV